MKRYKFLVIALLAIGMWSCSDEFQGDENSNVSADGQYEEVLISLTSTKGESIAIEETRVHVGQISGSTVKHHWDEGDKVGVFTLNSSATATNNLSQIDHIMADKNRAIFAGMITTDNAVKDYDLFVYYPYNNSLLVGATEQSAAKHLDGGITFRVPNEIQQSSYSNDFADANHPSRLAMTTYGLAYDLVDCKGTVGTFDLNHVNTYLQFNVFGKQTDNGDGTVGTDFANGNHRLSQLTVEVGTFDAGQFGDAKVIAGNYSLAYDYSEANFTDDPSKVTFTLTGEGRKTVKTVCSKQADGSLAPALKAESSKIPVFAMINTADILKDNTVNCMKVTVTTNEYNASGAITKVNTRVRYYNIASTLAAGGFKGGDFYSINFEMSDPVEQYTHLDADGNSNCYIIQGPGLYTYNVGIAGNGKQPHPQDYSTSTLGFDPANLITSDNFKLDWLWASGRSFDAVAGSDDIETVKKILTSIALSGTDGILQISLSEEQANLSGNIMVALYEDADDDNICDASEKIKWSWHLWLGTPVAQHYKFENTDNQNPNDASDKGEPLNNEDWHMLDRNLGAESNELGDPRAAGLYYQAGRKDPFIGYADQTGNTSWASNRVKTYFNTKTFPSHAAWKTNAGAMSVANVINYPMSLLSNTRDDLFAYGWSQGLESTINNSKTFLDPCPPGYKVPTTREWDNLKNSEYYCANRSITKTGVFGYCAYKDASFSTYDAGTTMKARVAAGDYYEVNAAGERTYHILANSGTGAALTTTFPNTGWLSAAGTFSALKGTTSTSTVTVVGAPQLSNVSGVANTTITQLASPTVLAEAITGESSVSVVVNSTSRTSSSSYGSTRYTHTITLGSELPSGYSLRYATSSNGSYNGTFSGSGTTYTLSNSRNANIYVKLYDGTNYSDAYVTSNSSSGNGGTLTIVANSITGYHVEMSRLSGMEYYWTTDGSFSTDNKLTTTQFDLKTPDTDIYIWVTDGDHRAYTRVQYSNGTVTTTKQYASTVSTADVDSYTLTISNWDDTKLYFWTTTPTFATTNEIEEATLTISTSSEQVYVWAQKDGTASQPSIIYYRDSRVGFTNGTPATDLKKDEITNNGGNFVLWSTGRVRENSGFEYMWFGAGDTGELANELLQSSHNPYSTTTTKEALILYAPSGVGGANNKMTNSPAAAVRCIREYNMD